MKLLLESWRQFINEADESGPKIITVDFDDTIRMSNEDYEDDESESEEETQSEATPNPIVIDKIREFKAQGAKVYLVTSRQDTKDNEYFIDDYLDTNDVPHDGIHLTNMKDKWYTVKELGSDMHFDDDDEEFKAIKHHIEEFPEDKQNIKLMKVDWKTGKVKEWKADLDEVYSEKQRGWACAQIDNPTSLTKKQAKEMCKGPTLHKKK